MPVLVYAREWKISEEKMYRALLVSNLVSIYIKHYIGALSAFCGAVSAACGSGAAITFMAGGDYQHIGRTITNTLANVGGIVCDGAKSSCAAKIAASVNAALLAHYMSMSDKQFQAGEGIVEQDVEETIKNSFIEENNAGIQMVMDSLGHTDNTSVMKYLSFDEERMRLCPLSLTQYSLLLEGGVE